MEKNKISKESFSIHPGDQEKHEIRNERRRFLKNISALTAAFTVSQAFGSVRLPSGLMKGTGSSSPAAIHPDKDGVFIISEPEHTPEQIAKAIAEIPKIEYVPSSERWINLPRTAAALAQDGGELKVVMLGDSIINDTYRSAWYTLLQAQYPKCKINAVAVVRGSTGCWWYEEKGRIKHYVLPLKPDLLIIGGISQKNDIKAIKKVIHQVRSAQPCDVLLVTNVFGQEDPNNDKQWSFDIPSVPGNYRKGLLDLSVEAKTGFFDMNAYWGRYMRNSGHPIDWFHRDEVHANLRGEQVIGHLMAGYLSPATSAG
ncbi:MAG TPA: hypothetical protein VGM24_03155 [Puia sp.]